MDTLLLDSDNLACGICDFQIAQTDNRRLFRHELHTKERHPSAKQQSEAASGADSFNY